MTQRLAALLSAARRNQFVGRAGERALMQVALTAVELPFHVLWTYGPGGVGKTALLREFARLSEAHGTPWVYLDARNVEPSPEAFFDALRQAQGLALTESPVDRFAGPGRQVLLIDTYERLAPLDRWLREALLPQLSENTLVVLAGRTPPSTGWLADAGWASVVRVLALHNLSGEESRAYLAQREVPVEQHRAVLEFTHGHPLALSLVADVVAQRPETPFQPEAAPNVLHALVERFVEQTPTPAHRMALEACARVLALTQPLLAAMLEVEDAHDLFEWLRGLSFIDAGPFGLFPHDLAREALAADLRWRDPERYLTLRRRAGRYYLGRLERAPTEEQWRMLQAFIFLHRDSPMVRPFFQWEAERAVFYEAARERDVPALIELVERYEGRESAEIALFWLRRQLRHAVVFREARTEAGAAPTLAGFLLMVALHEATAEDIERDPGATAAWAYVQRQRPLRTGEGASYRRFSMASENYQGVSLVRNLSMIDFERHLVTRGYAGPVFTAMADPVFWAPLMTYAGLARIEEADFEVGGRTYGVYGVDTRTMAPLERLTMLNEREAPPSGGEAAPAAVGLSAAALEAAVREALRHYSEPHALRGNSLLGSRVVERRTQGGGAAARVEALRAVVREAVETMRDAPRQVKWYRAVYHTYIQPAATQDAAAELLDVPYSSFRRHLQAGVERVVEVVRGWEGDS